jgi:hypothetical protein
LRDFEIPLGIPARLWEPDSFVREVGIREGEASSNVAEEIIAWAQRKHWQLRNDHPYASLDRLPTSTGPDPELWVQLDLRYPERLGWTGIEARKRMYDAIAALPRVSVEERLTGRPSFPMAALAVGDNLERFLRILEDAVDRMVESHKRSANSTSLRRSSQGDHNEREGGTSGSDYGSGNKGA